MVTPKLMTDLLAERKTISYSNCMTQLFILHFLGAIEIFILTGMVYDLYVACEKQPVRVLKDIAGMVANRILHAQARECFYLAEIGAASPEDIDKALKYGPCFRNATTGMLEVADMGVLDIWLATEDNMFPVLCNGDQACSAMRELVEAGHLGIKTGQGFFSYPEEQRAQTQTEFYKRLIVQLKASKAYD